MSLGIAARMIQVHKKRTASRLRASTGVKVADDALSLARLAESAHQVNAAAASLAQDWKRIAERSVGGEHPSQGELIFWRCNQAYAVKMCIEAVDHLFAGLGCSAWYADSEPQLLWRNAKMTGAHASTDYDIDCQINHPAARPLCDLDRSGTGGISMSEASIVFENERVRVSRVRVEPGETHEGQQRND